MRHRPSHQAAAEGKTGAVNLRPASGAEWPPHRACHELTIRPAFADDEGEIKRLAQLDDAIVPPGPLLLGEAAGELWVALSLSSPDHIADPFRPSAELVALVKARARQLRAEQARRQYGRTVPGRLVLRVASRAAARAWLGARGRGGAVRPGSKVGSPRL